MAVRSSYKKRDCGVVFDLTFASFSGWQGCRFSINGDSHKFGLSNACGSLFGRFVDIVYALYAEADDPWTAEGISFETNDPHMPHYITDIVGRTTWDNEGNSLEWTLSRALYHNKEKNVSICLDYDYGHRVCKYTVKLDDLMYATAAAATKVLKQVGICGYHFSAESEYINLNNFLMLKHFALTGEKLALTEDSFGMGVVFSSLEEEIELLLFDM